MKIYLRDLNEKLVRQWEKHFCDIDNVHISHGPIFDDGPHMKSEAIVSPANSFGFMDGGIDGVYTRFFGQDMVDSLQSHLKLYYNGELPVGLATAIMIPKSQTNIKWLICAPTMRVPSIVRYSVNAYLAFKAALVEATLCGSNSILCPGLGTAVGQMQPYYCALQMRKAYDDFLNPPKFNSLGEASKHHLLMREL